MASFFLKPSTRGHARSISLPARSHPTTLKIEEELNKLRNLEVFSSTSMEPNKLSIAIHGLGELYKSIGELLKLPQIQQSFTKHDDSSWLDELLEESVSFLDVCENIRQNIFLLKESITKLQSSLRRRNNGGESNIEEDVTMYVTFVKSLKKDLGKSIAPLKQIENKLSYNSMIFNKVNNDQQIIAVIRVLRETSLTSSFIIRSILGYFLGTPLQPKASKWSLVFKVVHNKGHVDDNINALEDLELNLNRMIVGKHGKEGLGGMIQQVCIKLQAFESITEVVDKELESLFRQLIHIRVSLLNILSDN